MVACEGSQRVSSADITHLRGRGCRSAHVRSAGRHFGHVATPQDGFAPISASLLADPPQLSRAFGRRLRGPTAAGCGWGASIRWVMDCSRHRRDCRKPTACRGSSTTARFPGASRSAIAATFAPASGPTICSSEPTAITCGTRSKSADVLGGLSPAPPVETDISALRRTLATRLKGAATALIVCERRLAITIIFVSSVMASGHHSRSCKRSRSPCTRRAQRR